MKKALVLEAARTVRRLAEEGIVVRIARGRYALIESMQNYIVKLRNEAAGRTSADGSIDAMRANAEFKNSQRRLNDIKIAAFEGKLISLEEVEDVWSALVVRTRQLFLAASSRIGFDLPHLTGDDQKAIEKTLRGMLEDVTIAGKPPIPRPKARISSDAEG